MIIIYIIMGWFVFAFIAILAFYGILLGNTWNDEND